MRSRLTRLLLFAVLAVISCTTELCAQTTVTGEIAGTVVDSSGAIVSGATVSLKNEASGDLGNAQTDGLGQFRFALLKPGAYTLTVRALGFETSGKHVNVNLGRVTTVPIKVAVGEVTTTIEVTGQPPLLDTKSSNLTTTYVTDQLAALPAPGGDITSYAYTAPGIVMNTGSGWGNFSAFGLPSIANLFTTNGNDNMDAFYNANNSGASNLSLGANELQEVVVVTNGYSAQYGRQAGAQVNASTKPGTNQFHGNALYWWNGRALNANEWFANHTGTPRAFANNNQWAASLGGPIVRNKLFFFVDQEGLRYVLPGAGGAIYLPTPQFANYVLSNVNTTTPGSLPFYQNIFNLYAGAPGANRAVPLSQADDPALGCGDFAQNNSAGLGQTIPCTMQFRSTQDNLNTEWLLTTRIDYNRSNADRLFGRFKTDHGLQATYTDPINPVFNFGSVQPEYEGQLNETHVFNSSAVNQVIISGMWYQFLFSNANPLLAAKAFPAFMQFFDGLLQHLGGGGVLGRIGTQYMIIDDFSKNARKHELKVGVNFRRTLISDYNNGLSLTGTLNINSMTEFVTGSFVGGQSNYTQTFSTSKQVRLRFYNFGAYAQDQWRESSKLTVTAGLRLENTENPSCAQNCFTRFVQPFDSMPHDPSVPYNEVLQTGLNRAFPDFAAVVWAPRLAIVYSATPNLVFKGGVGLFSDLSPGVVVDPLISNAPRIGTFTGGLNGGPISPNIPGNVFVQAAAANAAFQRGFAAGATLADLQNTVPSFSPPVFNTTAQRFLNPKYLEWNAQVEQQLGEHYTISLNYVGNHGFDVTSQNPWLNAYCIQLCPLGGVIPATVPDPRFTQVIALTNAGWSNYNGLIARFQYRFGDSFQGWFNYTWSHALDTCSNNCLLSFTGNTVTSFYYQVTPYLPGRSYGNSDYDVRHNFSASYVYNSKATWRSAALRHVLGGWTFAGVAYFHSGYPWSAVNSGISSSSLGNMTNYYYVTPLAEFLGGPHNAGGCSNPNVNCLTSSQFATASEQSGFGNLARNSFRGAGYFDTDLHLAKNIRLTERVTFSIGANFFNLLNHPDFDLPVNDVALGGAFGQIQKTVVPSTMPYGSFTGLTLSGRIIQLNGRITF